MKQSTGYEIAGWVFFLMAVGAILLLIYILPTNLALAVSTICIFIMGQNADNKADELREKGL